MRFSVREPSLLSSSLTDATPLRATTFTLPGMITLVALNAGKPSATRSNLALLLLSGVGTTAIGYDLSMEVFKEKIATWEQLLHWGHLLTTPHQYHHFNYYYHW